jgi:hypothetical protein
MKTFPTLSIALALAATSALAGLPKMPSDPCLDKAEQQKVQCNAKCFPVDPNTANQEPDDKQRACMRACDKKVAKVTAQCNADQAKKHEGKKEKDHARESDM